MSSLPAINESKDDDLFKDKKEVGCDTSESIKKKLEEEIKKKPKASANLLGGNTGCSIDELNKDKNKDKKKH